MLTAYLSALRQTNRNVRLYLVSVALLGFTASGGIQPVLLNLYLLRLGHGLDFVGLFNATGGLGFALFSLLASAMSRRWGHRRMMIWGLGLVIVSSVLLPLAEFVPAAWQKIALLLTRVPTSLGFGLFIVSANPFLMSSTTVRERTHVFSVQTALWPLVGFFGSLVGGFLPGFFAVLADIPLDSAAVFRYSLLLGAALMAPSLLALLATRPTDDEVQRRETSEDTPPVPRGPIAFIVLVLLLQTGCLALVGTFFNVYLEVDLGVSTVLIGVLFAAGQLTSGIATLATPLLSARWGHTKVIIWGSLATSLSLLPLVLFAHWGAAAIGYVGVTALGMMRVPAFMVYQQEMVPPRWWALMSGVANMAAGLSYSLANLSGGYLIPVLGYPRLCLLSNGLMVAGTLTFWAYFRVPRGEYANSGAARPPDA
jgi:MFS family permease